MSRAKVMWEALAFRGSRRIDECFEIRLEFATRCRVGPRLNNELFLSFHALHRKADVGRSRPECPVLDKEQAGPNPLSTPTSASPPLYKDSKGPRALKDD
jgi:hypothetical protein